MNLMGYRLIRTGSKQELEVPKIDMYAALRCARDVMDQVEQWIYTRAVLIYATGDLNDILANEYKVTRVTADTPEAQLRAMDVSKDRCYPVFLINQKYGIRGLDYRAANNPSGICMIICSPFSDRRTRLQALRRIRRYSDSGNYVQNNQCEEIDKSKFITLKVRIKLAEKEVAKLMPKFTKTKVKDESKTQNEENEKNYR